MGSDCSSYWSLLIFLLSSISHSKSLLILKAGYMYSAVFCAVMHGILLYIFS